MTAKRHDWFRFHAMDWLMGTHKMTLEQQGMYLRLLAVQWKEGSIHLNIEKKLNNSSRDVRDLSDYCLTDVRLISRLCPSILREKFEKSEVGWVNQRLENERQLQVSKHDRLSEAGRKGGLKAKPPRSIKKEKEREKENKKESKESAENKSLEIIGSPETPYAICETIKDEINKLCGEPTILKFKPSLKPIKDLLAQGVSFEKIREVYRAAFDPSLDGDRNALWHRGKLTNATFGQHLLNSWGDLQALRAPTGQKGKVDAVNESLRARFGG